MSKPMTAMIIMDGYGINPNPNDPSNAIAIAGTPCLDALKAQYPHGEISACGMDVGLPDGQMGNSEVGHLNIGAGRVVYQELTRITKSIRDGDFFENATLVGACESARRSGNKLHLMGLVSDGGVHSHVEHLLALVELAKRQGNAQVYIHAFMDGRDVPPQSGREFLLNLQSQLKTIGFGTIATVSGRYYAMDRDTQWTRVQKAYEAMFLGRGKTASSAVEAMTQSYGLSEFDEFVQPTVILDGGEPTATIAAGDSVIFYNFRPDRARELTQSIIDPGFTGFVRDGGFVPVHFVSMTQYDVTFQNLDVAYPPEGAMADTLGFVLAKAGLSQLRIAETTKYAHVTYFFNGGIEEPNQGEDRALIPTPDVATFDLKPEMSANEVADEAIRRIESGAYDAMILNFANCDMVGHTGIMDAAVSAVKTVDACVGRVVEAVLKTGGGAIITADHGNADLMLDPETGEPFTAHTTNPVPVIVVSPKAAGRCIRSGGRLADLAPTMLELLGIAKPAAMTGASLLASGK